jgi:hypothetical protein
MTPDDMDAVLDLARANLTPDELPADMEAVAWLTSNLADADHHKWLTLTVSAEDLRALLKAYQEQRRALELALDYLVEMEPGDSRAISNEFVAMLGVFLGVEPNTPGEDMAIIEKALEARRARAALTGEDTATLGLSGKTQTDARTRGHHA